MSGVFAVEDGEILWAYHPTHAVDHPSFNTVSSLIADAR
jgi:hypothetical protein